MSAQPPVVASNVAPLQPLAADAGDAPAQRWALIGRLFREKPLGAAGGVVCLLFLLCGIFADQLAPHGFNEIAPLQRLKPPSWAHWFGTD
ncbi:MAG TPA: hypothetical protein VJR89_22625, partial [Polyangiales bacterium]|nr:hypothetical protein [Polyangiales bacterium]